MHPNQEHSKALSVSELNRQVKRLLEVSYAQVWVKGEMSSFARPGSGHWYFSLKDEKAQIRAAMFKGANQRVNFQPKEGDEVIACGKLSLFEGRGDYQLIVERLEPAGIGKLQAQFDALKAKLSTEGLFDSARKKAIPKSVTSITVITSPTGAVIHDIISVCAKRSPLTKINLIPVSVQGETSAKEIANAIKLANQHRTSEVLIVGRGGGSVEDLWSFNEEIVARAIAESEIPIVSAVGHEVDFTISDFVADFRAPTPSAAAETLTNDILELQQRIDDLERRLAYFVQKSIEFRHNKLDALIPRIQTPSDYLEIKRSELTRLQQKSQSLIAHRIQLLNSELKMRRATLAAQNPAALIASQRRYLSHLMDSASQLTSMKMERSRTHLSNVTRNLNTLSPLATLDRGYAITKREPSGKVVSSIADVKQGERLNIQLKDGTLECQHIDTKLL